MAELNVNKAEAARRQIDAAIRLLFSNDDPIAIHVLATAAFFMLQDLAKHREKGLTRELLKTVIKPEKEGEMWHMLKKAYNFFKHANQDPAAVLEGIEETANDHFLFLACNYYSDMGHERTPEMVCFVTWYAVLYPDHTLLKDLVMTPELQSLRSQGRHEQIEIGMHLLSVAKQAIS